MKTKTCTKCKKEKKLSEFDSYKRGNRQQVRSYCRKCKKEFLKKYRDSHKKEFAEYRKANRDMRSRYNKEWEKEHPNYQKNYSLISAYGITLKDHKELYLKQNGCCAICNKPTEYNKIYTDHNHNTGVVRGLLCAHCNTWLAAIEDSEFVKRANSYLNGCK